MAKPCSFAIDNRTQIGVHEGRYPIIITWGDGREEGKPHPVLSVVPLVICNTESYKSLMLSPQDNFL